LETRAGNAAYGANGISHSLANTHLVICAIQNAIGKWVDRRPHRIKFSKRWERHKKFPVPVSGSRYIFNGGPEMGTGKVIGDTTMKAFNHTNAKTLVEAKNRSRRRQGNVIAGGTDLLGTLKDSVLPTYPAALINIKTIAPGLDYIRKKRRPQNRRHRTPRGYRRQPGHQQEVHRPGSGCLPRRHPPCPGYGNIGGNLAQLPPLLVFPQTRKPLQLRPQGRDYLLRHDGRQPLSLDIRNVNKCIAVHPVTSPPLSSH